MKHFFTLIALGFFMMNTGQEKESCHMPSEVTSAMLENPICVEYTNYKGKTAIRTIVPYRLWYGNTEYHAENQWLLDVWDIERNATRTYALKGIKNWFVHY